MELGMHREAVEDCLKAVKLDATDATAHYNLACAYSLLERLSPALQSLERAIVLEPRLRLEAKEDKDFDNIRSDARFARLVIRF